MSKGLGAVAPLIRRSVAVAAVATTVIPVAVGHGPAGAAASNVNPNGVLKYAYDMNNEFSDDFDPGTVVNGCSFEPLAFIYQAVTADAGNFAIMGGVAQSWQVTNNSSTITFHIRPGMVFSNGNPVTSSDVEASLAHIKQSPQRTSLSAIQTMTTPDPQTLVVNLNRPTAGDFLWALSFVDGMVMDPASIPNASTQPVGAGPFTLAGYQQGSSIQLTKNPRYWNSSAYPLGGLDFVNVTQGPEDVTALTSGAVDMSVVEPENVAALRGDPNIGLVIGKSLDYISMQLRVNQAPFTNAKVRAALEYAVDRSTLNRVILAGLGTPAYQPWPSWSAGYNKSLGNFDTYNPAKAKAMLKAAGFPHGVSFTMVIPAGNATFSRTAALLQAEVAAGGFKMSIDQIPASDLLVNFYLHKQGNSTLTLQRSNGPDISNSFESIFEPTGFDGQYLGTTNLTLTPLIQEANASLSPNVQGPKMQQVGKIVMTQGLVVPLMFEPSIIGYNKQRVGGKVIAPIGACRAELAGIYVKK